MLEEGSSFRRAARRGGVRFNPHCASLAIGRTGITFRMKTVREVCAIESFFRGFLKSPSPSDWRIDVYPGRGFPPMSTPQIREASLGFTVAWSRFWGHFSRREKCGELRAESTAVFGTFLRAFLSHVLAPDGGLLLHSAGVLAAGGAAIFAGVSGSGKSTMARLAAPARLLSDEIVLVERQGGGWTAQGTPFSGEWESGVNRRAPLGALYFLRKTERWGKRRLAPAAAARELLRCVLGFGAAPAAFPAWLEAVGDLVRRVPAYRLSFSRTLPKGVRLDQQLARL